uniref:ATP synthase F0 subunit 8 n=1 Tax=Haematopinus suis TaxID=511927 RepID=R9ZRZ5_9NEOP|nr:ATP synthase F0 subunit 8 [Haematopinus suis]
MPQMSPMWWLLLEVWFFVSFMSCCSCLYWELFVESLASPKVFLKVPVLKEGDYVYDM